MTLRVLFVASALTILFVAGKENAGVTFASEAPLTKGSPEYDQVEEKVISAVKKAVSKTSLLDSVVGIYKLLVDDGTREYRATLIVKNEIRPDESCEIIIKGKEVDMWCEPMYRLDLKPQHDLDFQRLSNIFAN